MALSQRLAGVPISHTFRLAKACAPHSSGFLRAPAVLTATKRHFGMFSRKRGDDDDEDIPMTRLGGDRSSSEVTPPSTATTRTNAPNRSDAEKLIATLQEQNRALADRVTHLSSELEHTQEMVRQLAPLVDREQHATELSKLASTLAGGGGMFLVQNSAELAHALTLPGARIVLTKGRLYVLDMFQSVAIRHTNVNIIGNGAVILGSFAISHGATLDVTDATLFAPSGAKPISRERFDSLSETEKATYTFTVKEVSPPSARECRHFDPVVSATSNSQVHLTRCTLSNGRDGVYLGLNSSAYLNTVKIVNCVRGVYEGVNCRAMLSGECELIGNYYHLVLLGKEKADRARAVMSSTSGQGDAANANATDRLKCVFKDTAVPLDLSPIQMFGEKPVVLRTSRADVVLEQDPIGDIYDACWKNGHPITLPEDLRTANLSDPIY